jgi:hypothetical protein
VGCEQGKSPLRAGFSHVFADAPANRGDRI